jgi:hypothetical protein
VCLPGGTYDSTDVGGIAKLELHKNLPDCKDFRLPRRQKQEISLITEISLDRTKSNAKISPIAKTPDKQRVAEASLSHFRIPLLARAI